MTRCTRRIAKGTAWAAATAAWTYACFAFAAADPDPAHWDMALRQVAALTGGFAAPIVGLFVGSYPGDCS